MISYESYENNKKIVTNMNFLKQGVLLFGLSLLLWNCEREEIIQEQ